MKKIKHSAIIALCIFSAFLISACASARREKDSPAPPEKKMRPGTPAVSEKTDAENEEYLRSINHIDVTKKTFEDDKAAIMASIDELSSIMTGGRYEAWLKFIDEESIRYWSNPKNLERASKMLPVKGLRMNSLRDYFTYIFVPSRKGRKVDEIRYDSKTSVKAVQVREDTDIIYYYFNKINGKWLVHIPPID